MSLRIKFLLNMQLLLIIIRERNSFLQCVYIHDQFYVCKNNIHMR